jgi:hypothetical protein
MSPFAKFIYNSGMTQAEIMRTEATLARGYDALSSHGGQLAAMTQTEIAWVRGDITDAGRYLWNHGREVSLS